MRKSLVLSSLMAVFVTGGALAADLSDSGTIRAMNQARHQITLSDGRIFTVPANWKFTGHKVGDKVRVTYQNRNGHLAATDIRPM